MNKLLMSLLLTLGVTTAVQAAGDATQLARTKVAMCGASRWCRWQQHDIPISPNWLWGGRYLLKRV